MDWMIPGTVLTGKREEADLIEGQFHNMFLAGGIILSQVTSITGLESYTVQNWVKRGFLPPPENKHYSLNQLCRIININMLKRILPMDQICGLLTYINGHLDDTSDDIIDDAQLYFMFVRLAAQDDALLRQASEPNFISKAMEDYVSPVPGGKERVEKVLRIMLTAWSAARLHEETERMLREL